MLFNVEFNNVILPPIDSNMHFHDDKLLLILSIIPLYDYIFLGFEPNIIPTKLNGFDPKQQLKK